MSFQKILHKPHYLLIYYATFKGGMHLPGFEYYAVEFQITVEKKLEWPENIYSTSELNASESSCFLKGIHHAERNRSLYRN